MKVTKETSIKLEIGGSDADNFKSLITKVKENNNQAGFTKQLSLTEKEMDLVNDINNELEK